MRIKIVLFLSLISLGFLAEAQVSEPQTTMSNISAFKAGLKSMTENTASIHSEFSQEKKLKVMRQPILSSGYILFKKPQNLKWAYTIPFDYSIVLTGSEIIIDDAGNVNAIAVSENQLFSDLSDMIIQSVEGSILDDPRFAKDYLENSEFNIVTLTPNEEDMQAYLQSMTLYFDKADFTVRQIIMSESEGNFTKLNFTNVKLNENISIDEFKKP